MEDSVRTSDHLGHSGNKDGSCLICNNSLVQSENGNRSRVSFPLGTCQAPEFLNNLETIFILKHVLELPSEHLETYLRGSPNPSDWIVICKDCGDNYVDRCKRIYSELLDVQTRFAKAKEQLVNCINRSHQDMPEEEEEHVTNIGKETRRFVLQHKYRSPLKKEVFVDRDLLASRILCVKKEESIFAPDDAEVDVQLPDMNDNQEGTVNDVDDDNAQDSNSEDEDWNESGDMIESSSSEEEASDYNKRDNEIDQEYHTGSEEGVAKSSSKVKGKRKRWRKKNSQEDVYICSFQGCGKIFHQKHHLTVHERIHKPPQLKCHICEKSFHLKPVLNRHVAHHQIEAEGTRFQCDQCPANYTNRDNLLAHKKAKHNTTGSTPEMHPCPFCGKLKQGKSILNKHIKDVHERRYECCCDLCGKLCSSSNDLKKHKFKVHERGQDHPKRHKIPCPKEGCKTRFQSEARLKKHLESQHDNPKEWKCTQCGKLFGCSSNLYDHVRAIHENRETKPFKCHLCGKGFAVKGYLRLHMKSKMHRGNKAKVDL